MGEREVENILEVLKKNIDICAWGPDEVVGVRFLVDKSVFCLFFFELSVKSSNSNLKFQIPPPSGDDPYIERLF